MCTNNDLLIHIGKFTEEYEMLDFKFKLNQIESEKQGFYFLQITYPLATESIRASVSNQGNAISVGRGRKN